MSERRLRRLAAILVADVAGYSRLAATDENATLARLTQLRNELFAPLVAERDGRVVKFMGDGALVEFASAVDAVGFAVTLQRAVETQEAVRPDAERLRLRIGINLGDVVVEDGDLYGDGVNIAARLEQLADVGGICIADSVRRLVHGKLEEDFEDTGERQLKNIPVPLRVWKWAAAGKGSRHGRAMPATVTDRPTVVVLPFDEIGPPVDDFFTDGVVEEVTSALSRVRDFFVIARQSAYVYKGRFVDAREIGRELGVRYVVEGTVRRASARVRISIQLVDAASGTQLWGARYEEPLEDLFEMQDRIASQVAGAISPSIRASEIAFARSRAPDDLRARDLVLRAYPHFWAHRKEDNSRAIELLSDALDRDPEYPIARALRAWCRAQSAAYMWSDRPAEARAAALADAEVAAHHAEDHAPTLVALGATWSLASTEYALARSFIERALAIDPNNAWGWLRFGWLEVMWGRFEEGLGHLAKAEMLSPLDPFLFNIRFGQAAAWRELGRFDRAIELIERGLHEGPGVTWAYRMLAGCCALAGQNEKAAAAVRALLHHYPRITVAYVRESVPPAILESNPHYFEGLRRAGLPEA